MRLLRYFKRNEHPSMSWTGTGRYGVDLSKAAPGVAVQANQVPVFLIHGRMDNNLPPRHSELIVGRNHGHNPQVVLWEPRDAGHCGASGAEPEEYARRVIGWFDAHQRPSA